VTKRRPIIGKHFVLVKPEFIAGEHHYIRIDKREFWLGRWCYSLRDMQSGIESMITYRYLRNHYCEVQP
jgi:hypothetical protein